MPETLVGMWLRAVTVEVIAACLHCSGDRGTALELVYQQMPDDERLLGELVQIQR